MPAAYVRYLTPPLFDARRREAAQASTDVRWVSGDAAALPFSDGSFDVVLSVFGAAFAPRQRATARELARVLRCGGRLAMFNWTARGGPGELLSLLAAQTPDQAEPPLGWGNEAHVRLPVRRQWRCACPSATRSSVTRCAASALSPNRSSTTLGSSGR